MATLTLPCPIWEGAFGTLQDAPSAAAASLVPTQPTLLKPGREPPQRWLQRWAPAHASARALSDSDFVDAASRNSAHSTPSFAVGWLCSEDSHDLRRAGAEADFSRAALPALDDHMTIQRHYRYPSGRESFDDLSTILTTSRSEYGASASASSWSSGSYCSAGPSWMGRTRTPSPEMERAVALQAYETPPRRLRMSANQPSPRAQLAGRQPQVTRLTTSATQVCSAGRQGQSRTLQPPEGVPHSEDSHPITEIVDDPSLRTASRGRQLAGFSHRRLPPPRPVLREALAGDTPRQLHTSLHGAAAAGTSHCSSGTAARSASCDPHWQSVESRSDDSRAELYMGQSPSIDRLLEVCRHLRESETRSGCSMSCASDVSSAFDQADGQALPDGLAEQSCLLQMSLPTKPTWGDEAAEEQLQKEEDMFEGVSLILDEDAAAASASHASLAAEKASSPVTCDFQEALGEMSSSRGPPSTVRSCASAQLIPSIASERSTARGSSAAAAERQILGSKAAAALRHCPQASPPAAAAVPMPLSVARTVNTALAVEHADAEPSDATSAASVATAPTGLASSISEAQGSTASRSMEDSDTGPIQMAAVASYAEETTATGMKPDGADLPTYLWMAGSGVTSAASAYPSEEAVASGQSNALQPIVSAKLQRENLSIHTGVLTSGRKENAKGAKDCGLPVRSATRLPDPPRSLRFEKQPQFQLVRCQPSVQDCDDLSEAPYADPWCTFVEDAVLALQLPKKGCRRASSWAPDQQNRCRSSRRRHSRTLGNGGVAALASNAAAIESDASDNAAAASARRARGHLHRACSRDQDDACSKASARRARSYLNRSESQNSLIRQNQEVLQAGQLKNLQKTRSQLKEEQRLAAAKVEELQQSYCRVTAVSDTDEFFSEVAQMLRTQGMPNVEIKSISRTVMNEKYAQSYQKNRGSKAERVLWLASPAVDTRQILESEHCLDYRHASFGQLGRGIYGADLAVYADMFAAHETESGVKQLLLYKGIVGKTLRCFVGSSENAGLSSLMRTEAPPGHDSTCAPEAALCKACAGTQPGCALEERCTCPFMPVGYQSEYGNQIKRRVSSPLYCLLPPAGHIQDQLLMEPSELEPYVLALPVALVEYVNPESKACNQGELKWWHPDVATVLQRYQKALADDWAKRSAALENALAHRDCLEVRTAEAELDLAVEREDKKQLEKTIKALQSERDRLQIALSSVTGSPDATARDGWCQSQSRAASVPPSVQASPDPTAMLSPAPTSCHVGRGETPAALNRSGSPAGSEDSDHPEEYWKGEFSEMPRLQSNSGDENRGSTIDEHDGKHTRNMARHGLPRISQLRALRRQRIGLDFRSVKTANAFIKTVKENASPTALKENRTHGHQQNTAPFAPSTLGHCVVLGDPVESELIDAPELIEIRLRHTHHASSLEQDAGHAAAQPGLHPPGNAGIGARQAGHGRHEATPPRLRQSFCSRSWPVSSWQRDSPPSDSASMHRSQRTSRAAIETTSASTTRHVAAFRRRRVKFCDELDGHEPNAPVRKRLQSDAVPQMEENVKKVMSILKLARSESM